MTPERLAEYRRTALRRDAERRKAVAARQSEALAVAHCAAELLRNEFGATRVVLFGSLARGATFHIRSDIDLAIEGIGLDRFFASWAAVDRVSAGFRVDLEHFPSSPAYLRDEIETRGVEL